MKQIELPEALAIELEKIDWTKVKQSDLSLLIKFGLPFLKRRGVLKDEKKEKNN
jgi:hypothetical protein